MLNTSFSDKKNILWELLMNRKIASKMEVHPFHPTKHWREQLLTHPHIWRFPEIGLPPVIHLEIFMDGIFHELNHPSIQLLGVPPHVWKAADPLFPSTLPPFQFSPERPLPEPETLPNTPSASSGSAPASPGSSRGLWIRIGHQEFGWQLLDLLVS